MKLKIVGGQGRTAEVPDQVMERGGQNRTLASLLTQPWGHLGKATAVTRRRLWGTHFTFPLRRLDLDV